MKVQMEILVTRKEGPRVDNPEVAAGLREMIDELDLWLDDSQYEATVTDLTYPDGHT